MHSVYRLLAMLLATLMLVAPLSASAQSIDDSSATLMDGGAADWQIISRSSTSSDFYKDESMLTGSSTKTEWSGNTKTTTTTTSTGTQNKSMSTTATKTGASKTTYTYNSDTEAKSKGFQSLNVKTNVDLYTAGAKTSDAVWGVGDWGGSNFSVLGYEGLAYGSVSTDGKSLSATGGVSGKAWAVRAKLNETYATFGDDELGAKLGIYVDARVGAEAGTSATAKVSLEGVGLSGNVNAFAGAKVDGWLPVSISFCYLSSEGRLKGQLSAGIGGTASASVEIDWANLEVKLSTELAGTLGLGAGAGGEVRINLGALISDPGKVADCLLDKLQDLGEMALEAGEMLVDTAGAVIEETVALVEAGAEVVVDAATALADGVVRVSDAIAGTATSVASSLWGFVSSVIGGGDSSGSGCP